MMVGSQTGTIRLLGDFWSKSSSRGNVTDDNSSSCFWQLASAKSYGGRLDLWHFWRPFISLLFSKRTQWQCEGRWILIDYSPQSHSKVGEKFLLLPNQREQLNDNMSDIFVKTVSLKKKEREREREYKICPRRQVSWVFDKDSDRQSRSKLLTDCFNAASNVSLKTCSRLDVLPYCLYIRKSM